MKININETSLSNINQSLSTHYLIYKITNKLNGMYYIGQHKTNNPNDLYSGSGFYLKRAQEKYGISNFIKDILFDFDNFDDMNNKERELVQLSNCFPYNEMSYNLREGGNNGAINDISIQKMVQTRIENGSYDSERNFMYGKHLSDLMEPDAYNLMIYKHVLAAKKRVKDQEWLNKMSEVTSGENNGMFGKHLSDLMDPIDYENMCSKRSKNAKGENNPMFGKSSWAKCTPEQKADRVARFSASMKGKNKGRKFMRLPNDKKCKFVKPNEVQQYLNLGYRFCNPKTKKFI